VSTLRRRHRRRHGTLDFTSLVDVALVLVVFFLLSAQAGGLHSLPVTLPQAGSAGTEQGTSLEIAIDRGGAISLHGRHLELAELAGVAAGSARIILVADAEARHGRVVEVVDALRRGGAREIYFATRPPVQDW
jgi:biopolymer transport protein ExbD